MGNDWFGFRIYPRKGTALMKRLREKEMFEEDEDFPKHEEETHSVHLWYVLFFCFLSKVNDYNG